MKHTIALLTLLFACGTETSTPGGQGGRTGSGGSVPGSGGSTPGTGGSTPGTGGNVPGTGGQGTGGGAMGGASGTGGAGQGTGGAGQGGAGGGSSGDVAPESATEVPGNESNPPEPPLNECFQGLPTLMGNYQISNKRSADGKIHMRIALERIPDSVGTSGTVPWRVIRIGIVTPTAQVCVQQAALASAYMSSHHNCNDTLTVSSGGVTYQLKWPDTDQVVNKRDKTTIAVGGAAAVPLQTTSCTSGAGAGMCRSGGPC